MTEDYLQKINGFLLRLEQPVKQAIEATTRLKVFAKGDYLLKSGQVCRCSYLITGGVARKFYYAGEKEITTEFYFVNDIAISFISYSTQQPSAEFIQAIEPVTAHCTDYNSFQSLKKQFSVLEQLDLLLTEYYCIWLEERLFEMHTMNTTERYRQLLQLHPQIIQYIPLTYIASYLNVSLETLSRIRAKK
jgi:CRP-like cAMP-binding protein